MATVDLTKPTIKPTLGLVGALVNAMALIAPGAFLWITYQVQASATAPDGSSVYSDIWAGIIVALIVAFLTAISYAELAAIYPEAGFKSVCYFVEKTFSGLKKREVGAPAEKDGPYTAKRVAKLFTAWSAHLFYWVYPGVMVAMMAMFIGYIYTQFTGKTFTNPELVGIGVVFTFVCAYIAYRGINGSTLTAIWINGIQLVALVIFSGLAIWYRVANPQHATHWAFTGSWDVMRPHSLMGVMVQSTIAILILVGFESCTALAAETKQPEKNIPKAIILALIIQGLFAYLFEYFCTGLMISDKLVGTVAGKAVYGLDAAAASSAPIGDLARLLGDSMGGIGFGLMVTIAITVGIAIIGTTLSCMNTAVRISCAMSEDKEFPELLGFMHGGYSTPHIAIWALALISSIIGGIGVWSVVGLTGITLASNLGTFCLYGMTCLTAFVAFKKRADFNVLKHGVVPLFGLLANIIMVVAILYLYIIGNSDAKNEAWICFAIAGGWALISLIYVAMSTLGKAYHLKMVSAIIRPEYLNLVVEALRQEDYIMGMTVTKVRGFGRQKGNIKGNPDDDGLINFLPKVKVDVVVKEAHVPEVMDIISEGARTGNVGDGKIFVIDASQARRIRTADDGVWAI